MYEQNRGTSLVDPMVKNLPSNAGDTGSAPGQGTKIPHALGQINLCTTMKTQQQERRGLLYIKIISIVPIRKLGGQKAVDFYI